jgi:hypothetical protein
LRERKFTPAIGACAARDSQDDDTEEKGMESGASATVLVLPIPSGTA